MMQKIKNWFFGKFINVVHTRDVITDRKGVIYMGNDKISDIELSSLQSEIKALDSMRIWSILNETVKQQAFDKGWLSSTTLEHLNTAKTMYYTLDLQKSIIDIIRNKDLTQKG